MEVTVALSIGSFEKSKLVKQEQRSKTQSIDRSKNKRGQGFSVTWRQNPKSKNNSETSVCQLKIHVIPVGFSVIGHSVGRCQLL
jgi:hypothetical protein